MLRSEEGQKENDVTKDQIALTTFYLKQWLLTQEHLPHSMSDSLLFHFAATAKGNKEKATKRIDSYYTVKTVFNELFFPRDPTTLEFTVNSDCLLLGLLPGTTSDGSKVFIFGLLNSDPTVFDLSSTVRRFIMFLELNLVKHNIKPGQGVYLLTDAKGASIGHIMKLSPSLFAKSSRCLYEVQPMKVKGFIFINTISIIRVAINSVILPVFPSKLKERIIFCEKDDEVFRKLLPKEIVPKEYGGNGISFRELSDITKQYLNANREWFLTEGSVTSDESKRSGKSSVSKHTCIVM